MELKVDPERRVYDNKAKTGIYVRALHDGKFISCDIAELDKESLLAWLRSRGGKNEWAENTVLVMLGHSLSLKESAPIKVF